MKVAILTFDGFSEADTFLALALLNQRRAAGWSAELASPAAQVTSMNGVTVTAQQPLEFANEADAVLFGHGLYTRAIAENSAVLDRLQPDPVRQHFGGLSSGALLMARLGLLGTLPASTDAATRPFLVEAGVLVLDEPFHAGGSVATAGGLLAAPYLAAWLIARADGTGAAEQALRALAPVHDKHGFVQQVMAVLQPFLGNGPADAGPGSAAG
jgi:transcriptional regulator GlxA family with amidase domain